MIQLDDLFGDNKLIHGISQNKIQKCINYYKQNIENKDTNIFNYNYNSIIKRTAILINELNIKNPLDASIVFEYLLWNGYLSKNKKITFSNYNRVINLTALGADIMRGKTVCLNNCDMLCRILRELKYTSHMVACDVNLSQNTNICYKPNIKEKTVEKQKLLKILNMIKKKCSNNDCDEIIEGNHVNTLIFHNNQYFIIDPTNLGLMYFDKDLKAKYYFSSLEADILLWPILAFEGLGEKEFSEIISYQIINNKTSSIIASSLDYMNSSSNVVELCENNLNLINDFYIENINDINSICKTLK